jgi:hypothetical protein
MLPARRLAGMHTSDEIEADKDGVGRDDEEMI